MTEIDEVLIFARDFVNNRSCRTPERKAKIRDVIKRITGEKLGKSCGTCYIEAIFKILKLYKMAQYELKRGYVAQFDGDFHDIKAFTNANLLNDPGKYDPICAEWAKRYPAKADTYLVRRPGSAGSSVPPEITIIPPKKVEVKAPESATMQPKVTKGKPGKTKS